MPEYVPGRRPDAVPLQLGGEILQCANSLLALKQQRVSRTGICSQRFSIRLPIGGRCSRAQKPAYFPHRPPGSENFQVTTCRGIHNDAVLLTFQVIERICGRVVRWVSFAYCNNNRQHKVRAARSRRQNRPDRGAKLQIQLLARGVDFKLPQRRRRRPRRPSISDISAKSSASAVPPD